MNSLDSIDSQISEGLSKEFEDDLDDLSEGSLDLQDTHPQNEIRQLLRESILQQSQNRENFMERYRVLYEEESKKNFQLNQEMKNQREEFEKIIGEQRQNLREKEIEISNLRKTIENLQKNERDLDVEEIFSEFKKMKEYNEDKDQVIREMQDQIKILQGVQQDEVFSKRNLTRKKKEPIDVQEQIFTLSQKRQKLNQEIFKMENVKIRSGKMLQKKQDLEKELREISQQISNIKNQERLNKYNKNQFNLTKSNIEQLVKSLHIH